MKIAYVTDFNVLRSLEKAAQYPHELGHWGRCYYIAKSLTDESTVIHYLGPLEKKSALLPKLKWRFYYYIIHQVYHPWAEPIFNKYFAHQILDKLSKLDTDIVVCPDINLLSYLNCSQPKVLWVDTLYAGLINFYTAYYNLCRETIHQLTRLDQLALDRCQLAIFSSEWAAKTALETYQVDPSKVKVIPSGANIECNRTLEDITTLVEARPSNKCKLLFFGVDWYRKGGNIALEVARELNKIGLDTELTVVGCQPPAQSQMDDFVVNLGFISKTTEAGLKQINTLLSESHFLILPSRAETYGNVFCEANSFGVPCLGSNVGGIPTVIKDNLNGKIFDKDAAIDEYCTYIYKVFSNYTQYKELALSSFHDYQTRLNWSVAGQTAKKLFRELLESENN